MIKNSLTEINTLRRKVACLLAAALVIALSLIAAAACKSRELAAPQYLPAACYDCFEVIPQDLVNNYFSTYGNMSMAENSYNNKYFVFKNLPVKEWMIADLDQGFIWVGSGIKGILANPADMKKFKLDAHIDVVGLNAGVISYTTPGLLFKDCYVIPTGSVQLPASGSGGFVPLY